MKFTYVLALVLVLAVVAMAAKPDKAARKAKKAERKARQRCMPYEFTYTRCENSVMSITKTPPAGVEGCVPETVEKPCVDDTTPAKTKKNGCVEKRVYDRTACGDSETAEITITITKTGCKKEKRNKTNTITTLCKTGDKPKGGRAGNKKNNKRKGGKGNGKWKRKQNNQQ